MRLSRGKYGGYMAKIERRKGNGYVGVEHNRQF